MKKLLSLIVFTAAIFAFSAPKITTAKTSFEMQPYLVSVDQWQTFKVTVKINPNGVKNFTVESSIKFPAELVSLIAWQYDNAWLDVRQPGYDSFSGADGALVKTAGYPGGFSSAVAFGTATFLAKNPGEGTVEFSGNNASLDENSQNQFDGGNKVEFIVNQPKPGAELRQPLAQEFSVNLEVNQLKVSKIDDLRAAVSFSGSGDSAASFDMTFDILNETGEIVQTDRGKISIQGKGEYSKSFSGFNLPAGDYTLRLITLRDGITKNEFAKPFSIVSEKPASGLTIFAVLFTIAILAALILAFKKIFKK